jgi:hypothetical protein
VHYPFDGDLYGIAAVVLGMKLEAKLG